MPLKSFVVRWLSDRRWPFIAAGLAILATLPAIRTGFVADDFVHRALFLQLPGFQTNRLDMFAFVHGGPERLDELRRLALPWWTADDLRLSFWRPVTALTHYVDYALWPDAAWAMHLQSLIWYGGVVVLAGWLFKRILAEPWQAGLATFVYGMSHTHAVDVFFLANRNALVAAFFGLAALIQHDRWRREGHTTGAILGPLLLVAGLLANEGVVAFAAYLFTYAVFMDRGTPRQRVLSLLAYAAIVVGWQIVYRALGHGASASEAYVDPVASPMRFVSTVAARGPLYLLAQFLVAPTEWSVLAAPTTLAWWRLAAVGFFVVLLMVFYPLLRRDRTARFWFAGMLLTLIPIAAAFPSDRMLLISEVGGAAVLCQWLAAVRAHALWPTTARVRRIAARVLFDVLVAIHVVLAPVWFPVRLVASARSFDELTDGVEALAVRDDLTGKLVVLIDDVMFTGSYFTTLRALSGREPVGQLLVLAPVTDRFASVVLKRTSSDSLVMDVEPGYDWWLERDRQHPFTAGQSLQIGRVGIEIQRVDDSGHPTRVAFRFDRPLDDESIVWFGRLESPTKSRFALAGHYPPWKPPAIGTAVAAQ